MKGALDMDKFEELLADNFMALDRFVKFKVSSHEDAEDIVQDVCLTASQNYYSLHNALSFKAWLIGIAKNKIKDYYRKMAKSMEIPIDALSERVLSYGRTGISETSIVRDTLDMLGDKDKQILYLYYFRDLPQSDIANRLKVPIGTVKSRLFSARKNFKEKYPYQVQKKNRAMKKLPEIMPDYKITKLDLPPFEVKWEEMMGWFIVPKLGERLSFGIYDLPGGKRSEQCDLEVVGKAEVHGIEGVEIIAVEHDPVECNRTDNADKAERKFVAQLTETHCRILAESHVQNGVRHFYTFLDADDFLPNWGFGENNCGSEVNIKQKSVIHVDGINITCDRKDFMLDIVGRYKVEINGKTYDTVCVVDLWQYEDHVVSQQFLDKNGKTVLWRRFNADDWAFDRYKKKWTEMLPDNERLFVNGETYVHWYDCITDYIL